MKNNKTILTSAIVLAGCSAPEPLVKRSDICLSNAIATKIYFRDCELARQVAKVWEVGSYGRAKVLVLDSSAWARLERKAVPAGK